MTEEEKAPAAPTAEEMQQMTEVSAAGATAVTEGKDPAEAMKQARDRVGLVRLDDETIEKLAELVSDRNIDKLRVQGAFDPPPEPVKAPEQPHAPPAPQPTEEPVHQPAPVKRSPAQRFLGLP